MKTGSFAEYPGTAIFRNSHIFVQPHDHSRQVRSQHNKACNYYRDVSCSAANSAYWTKEQQPAVSGRLKRFVEEAPPSPDDRSSDAESRNCAVALAEIAWEIKAEDISVLHVAPLVYWCSYMVILNVKSRPQLQAVIAKIEREAAENWNRRISTEASTARNSSWEVLDFQDVVIQIFTPEQREFYALDAYYGMAEVCLSHSIPPGQRLIFRLFSELQNKTSECILGDSLRLASYAIYYPPWSLGLDEQIQKCKKFEETAFIVGD